MQSLAEKSLHQVSSGSDALKPEGENTDQPPRTMGFTAVQKLELKAALRSRRWRWAMGATCAAVVLVLFGLFHPRPQSRMGSQAERTAIPAAGVASMATAARTAESMDVGLPSGAAGMSKLLTAASEISPDGPMIARTVGLTIQVKDVPGSRSALDAILARYQGYAAELNIYTPENAARSFTASLRIPAPALDAALTELRKLGQVQNESQSGEEVTQQHTDLVARLNNARETEQRLTAILQKRTGKVSEVLEVEEQISNTRGQIERMEAEVKALEHRVDFATVRLQLAEQFKAQLNPPSATVGTRMNNAFVAGLSHAGESILGIMLLLAEYGPALLVWCAVLGGPVWLVWRRYRKAETGAAAN